MKVPDISTAAIPSIRRTSAWVCRNSLEFVIEFEMDKVCKGISLNEDDNITIDVKGQTSEALSHLLE